MVSALRRMCVMTAVLVSLALPAVAGTIVITAAPAGATCTTVYEGAKCDPSTTTTQGVQVEGVQQTAGNLPRTGSDVWPMVQVGAVLVVGGALLVLAVRRRTATPV